jgi:uncharacterized membrane protein YjgN (DUF898 family)
MRLSPYAVLALLIFIIAAAWRYNALLSKIRNDGCVFSIIALSAEVSSRAFSHCIKSELLGVMAAVG